VLLGHVPITLRQLEQLQEGQVLHFKKPDYGRALFCDLPAFDVELGNLGAQVAIKIVDPVAPQPNA
jgi:flagellar motor switch protein FliM